MEGIFSIEEPSNVAPPEAIIGAVRVQGRVAVKVVVAMGRHPEAVRQHQAATHGWASEPHIYMEAAAQLPSMVQCNRHIWGPTGNKLVQPGVRLIWGARYRGPGAK
jgi:hypothetical protein